MQIRDEAKLTMFRNTALTCREHSTITVSVQAFEKARLLLDVKISAITALAAAEKEVGKGVGTSKKLSQVTACALATDVAGLVFAYASATGNSTLKASMKFAVTDLKRLNKESLLPTLLNISKAVQANLKDLEDYGLSAVHVAMLDKTIDDYTGQVALPQHARTERTTYTKGIKKLVQETDALLKEQMDKVIAIFKNDHPEFVAKYKAARTIYDPPTQRTQIKGKVLAGDSGKMVKYATIALTGPTELVLQSNAAGNFTIKPLPPGKYQVLVKAEGFADTVLEELLVKLGKVTRVTVNLHAA